MNAEPRAADVDCKREAGVVAPVIDPNRCEGKGACVEVCPYDVFAMGVLPREARQSLTIMGRIKGLAHGWKQASAVNAQACHACGLCVAACPETAIVLRPVS
jgi:4Fe-4S ferredoxin